MHFLHFWGDHKILNSDFVHVVEDMDLDAERSLPSWCKSHLIMTEDPLGRLMDMVCYYLVGNVCIYVHQGRWGLHSLLMTSWSALLIRVTLAWWDVFTSVPFPCDSESRRKMVVTNGTHQHRRLVPDFGSLEVFVYWLSLLSSDRSDLFRSLIHESVWKVMFLGMYPFL